MNTELGVISWHPGQHFAMGELRLVIFYVALEALPQSVSTVMKRDGLLM
jgi:hypothetical protein